MILSMQHKKERKLKIEGEMRLGIVDVSHVLSEGPYWLWALLSIYSPKKFDPKKGMMKFL